MTDSLGAEPLGAEIYDVEPRRGRLRRWTAPLGRCGVRGWLYRGIALVFVIAVFYYPIGMIIATRSATILPLPRRTGGGAGLPYCRHRRGADRPGGQPVRLAGQRSVLHAVLADRQHAKLPARHDRGPGAFCLRVDRSDRPHAGSSQADPDLQEAAGLLQYSGTKWVFDLTTSLAPTATSEAQYRKARRALLAYNARLASGDAVFERRSDNLLATLDRMAADLGSSSAALDQRLNDGPALFDTQADDVFYGVKGQLYAYYLLLRELRIDFASVVGERELATSWDQMLASMGHAASLQPWVVTNGAPDSQAIPSHLAAQGFFLLRARTQLKEITNILLK